MKLESIERLFEEEIKDLYDAEKRLVKALPKLAKAATSGELRAALEEHLETTRNHVRRLEEVFELIETKPKGVTCEGMKGLVAEGEEAIEQDGDGVLRDVAIIGAAKRVEHYEMGGYQSAIMLADAIGNEQASDLLGQTLGEEEEADQKLESLGQELLKSWSGSASGNGGGATGNGGVERRPVASSGSRGKTRRAAE